MRQNYNLPVAGAHRHGLAAILERGGEHELRTKLREAGGDDLFVQGMVADLGANGWCPACKRAHSPSMYRLYAQIAKAVDGSAELAAQLMAALERVRPASEAMERAQRADPEETRRQAIAYIARHDGLPESVVEGAIARLKRVEVEP